MADFQGFTPSDEAPSPAGALRLDCRKGFVSDAPTLTTYVYRTTAGAIGSTNSLAGVPPFAGVVFKKFTGT